ncbi:2,4-dichlorophenol 6-monooxygenase [Rhodobiaceae bacterium]|nr:2,4-dichlorophenol 6-monooxygenase [Rhodobiaceae bacterium]
MTVATQGTEKTPVLIVGGGPTGLLASLLLSRLQVDHILVERRQAPQPAPAAHVVNTRTMEILRAVGLNTGEFYALDRHRDARFISWVSSPRDKAMGQLSLQGDTESADDLRRLSERAAASPEHITNISQNLFEEALLSHAVNMDHQDIRLGHSWQGFVNGDTHRVQVTDPDGTPYEVTADYVLAADGASSGIARALGVDKSGPTSLATFLNLSCEVDLTQIVAEQQSLLYWCLSPETPGILIVHDPKSLTVYMRPVFEPYETAEDYSDERCETLIKEIFGSDVPVRITYKGVWNMSAQVAERFAVDNVFLVGDAAHRFPPTGGLGLNSGAGDIHNLVWKLAAVLKHNAPSYLLSSYEAERKPVAERNCATSVNNFLKMKEVTDTLGLDADKAHLPAMLRASPFARWLPSSLIDWLLKLLSRPALRKLQTAMSNTSDGEMQRQRLQKSIDNQAEHFDMLGAELGYIYSEGCAVDPSSSATPTSTTRDYTPTSGAGARLPHISLEENGTIKSSLDLVSYDGFRLFTNGTASNPPNTSWTQGLPCQTVNLEDFNNHTTAAAAFDLEPGSWVLVRPDGHVATRSSPTLT